MTKARPFLVSLVLLGAHTIVLLGCARSAPNQSAVTTPTSAQTQGAPNASSRVEPTQSPKPNASQTLPNADSQATTGAAPVSLKCPVVSDEPAPGVACGDLHCLAFPTELDAFRHVLALSPRILGIGESHAPKGVEGVHSATRRFGELLLPALCGRARSMVLELWLPRNDCGDKRVEQVKKAQEPVTQAQAKSNQNEYVTLGHVAKRFGIMPSALIPTCDEYQSILDAAEGGIERMLALVGQRSGEEVLKELRKYPNQAAGPVVVAYGGAMHNDVAPDAEHARYSYGPKLLDETRGQYVELDLIVPEFVKDTDLWKRQPWYSAFKNDRNPTKTKLYQMGPQSFALVFAASKPVLRNAE